jgi:hypothetical protein
LSPLITLVQAAALGAPPSSPSRGLAFSQSTADTMSGAAKRPAPLASPLVPAASQRRGLEITIFFRASTPWFAQAGGPQGPAPSPVAVMPRTRASIMEGEIGGSHEVEFEHVAHRTVFQFLDVRPRSMLRLRRSSPTCRKTYALRFNGRRSYRRFSRTRRRCLRTGGGSPRRAAPPFLANTSSVEKSCVDRDANAYVARLLSPGFVSGAA